MAKISVLGSGSWGMALALLLHNNGHEVLLWSARPEDARKLREKRENPSRLPGVVIPDKIEIMTDLERALRDADAAVLAVASPYIRSTAHKMAPYVREGQKIVNVAKGIEEKTLKTLSEVIEEEIPQGDVAVLSGPSHAEEVGKGIPTTCVVSAHTRETADYLQGIFMSPVFRVYTTPDILGVELGGALKNVIALAAGTADGLGYGDNTKAALITRGITGDCKTWKENGSTDGNILRSFRNRRSDRYLCECTQPQPKSRISHWTGKDNGTGHGRSSDGCGRCLLCKSCKRAF